MVATLSAEEIREFISSHNIARIGCNDGERTYVVPINYLYFDSYFLCYSLDGLKIEMMRDHPLVCLEIDDIKSVVDWTCVLVFGRYEEISDPASVADAKKHFTESYVRLKAEQTPLPPEATSPDRTPHETHREIVCYRIHIEDLSGRLEKR
jgi:nitroimidazol reductase NimA-like FMN-containing flavoprotein (pyridoxamine 5'-phosphate oxidase superfamily)